MKNRRYFVHVDMDAFFAAIEQRDNPRYRYKPVVVGADPKGGNGRGVVSTCSYEARRFGIHSAMPISIAYRKCPKAIFLPVNMQKYQNVSEDILAILYSFTPDIEPVSIDEAFLDITGSYHLFSDPEPSVPNYGHSNYAGTPLGACLNIKYKIRNETGLTASIGLAPIMMAAKIASDLKKPDGIVEITEENLSTFLRPLDIRRIWGVGPKAEQILNNYGIKTIGELADRNPAEMHDLFGKAGLNYWNLANCVDDRVVTACIAAKSVSNETTFDTDTDNARIVEGAIMSLCGSVSGRMRRSGARCRTVTLKIRLADFKTYTRSITLPRPTDFADLLYKAIKAIYNDFDTRGKRIRLVGVKASNISLKSDKELFIDEDDSKKESVHAAIDKIANKFGDEYICRATSAYFTGKKG